MIALSSLPKVGGDQPTGDPRVAKVEGDQSPPVLMAVAPMTPQILYIALKTADLFSYKNTPETEILIFDINSVVNVMPLLCLCSKTF